MSICKNHPSTKLRRGGLLSLQEVRQHINRQRKHNRRVLLS
ncbi:hypothetical protein TcasGA2_TC031069 [Tribolium castaneum]|uniref:Uncharacterized protein n=1 Tax=Tribolium castaneum TaxID=7070 RepID=A0A139WJW0_TRICA|nr:hypothetical protein TcasGA2_TC031069 [Tribolium castaneum]